MTETLSPSEPLTPELAEQVVARYLATWNETDAVARRAACEQLYATDARFVDPFVDATGPAAIAEFIGGIQAQFPDHELAPTTAVDVHHDVARFEWAGTGPDGAVAFAGTDVITLGAAGRVVDVTSFIGPLAART